ncbi:hypothetical protein B0H14DRAFT_3889559, partial [Mycena olivaceomarginata]
RYALTGSSGSLPFPPSLLISLLVSKIPPNRLSRTLHGPSPPFRSPLSLCLPASSFDALHPRATLTRPRPSSLVPCSFSLLPSPSSPFRLQPHTTASSSIHVTHTPRRLCTCDPLTPCTHYRLLTPDTLLNFSSAVHPRVSDAHSTTRFDSRARPVCLPRSLFQGTRAVPTCVRPRSANSN